jgi:hypothetical protein
MNTNLQQTADIRVRSEEKHSNSVLKTTPTPPLEGCGIVNFLKLGIHMIQFHLQVWHSYLKERETTCLNSYVKERETTSAT